MDGFLLVNKDSDWTSRDVCNKVQSIFDLPKVGHIGTLDPFATGLLILGVNKATKGIAFFDDFDKELSTHVVNTHYYFENGGLDDKSKIDRAIQILNGKLNTAEECAAMFKEYTDIERGMLF